MVCPDLYLSRNLVSEDAPAAFQDPPNSGVRETEKEHGLLRPQAFENRAPGLQQRDCRLSGPRPPDDEHVAAAVQDGTPLVAELELFLWVIHLQCWGVD